MLQSVAAMRPSPAAASADQPGSSEQLVLHMNSNSDPVHTSIMSWDPTAEPKSEAAAAAGAGAAKAAAAAAPNPIQLPSKCVSKHSAGYAAWLGSWPVLCSVCVFVHSQAECTISSTGEGSLCFAVASSKASQHHLLQHTCFSCVLRNLTGC
jgi:hypothetical protein